MSSTGNIRVSGGIISDQMLTGSQRYFKLSGADFSGTISDGTVTIPMDYGSGLPIERQTIITIGEGHPVPNSAADQALFQVAQKATIGIVGVDAEIHYSLENTSMGWEIVNLMGGNTIEKTAAEGMQEVIRALGTVSTPTGDVDLSSAVVTEVDFKLA